MFGLNETTTAEIIVFRLFVVFVIDNLSHLLKMCGTISKAWIHHRPGREKDSMRSHEGILFERFSNERFEDGSEIEEEAHIDLPQFAPLRLRLAVCVISR